MFRKLSVNGLKEVPYRGLRHDLQMAAILDFLIFPQTTEIQYN